jgi:hypothetical protein
LEGVAAAAVLAQLPLGQGWAGRGLRTGQGASRQQGAQLEQLPGGQGCNSSRWWGQAAVLALQLWVLGWQQQQLAGVAQLH